MATRTAPPPTIGSDRARTRAGYDAFVSYSHAADGGLAPALQAGLQRLARRLFQRRALRVFRDETGLSTNPHLWASIESALDASERLVLLASPESAASAWVEREVTTFLAHRPVDRVLVVVTDGELAFTPAGRIDPAATTCLPPSLVAALDDEPRWLDLRWARTEAQLDLRNGRFRAAVADLAAPMHGMAKDELEGEDVRQQRRARHLAVAAGAIITTLAVLATAGGVVAVAQRNTARAERDRADAQRLAALASALSSTQLDTAMLLAIEGYRLDSGLETSGSLVGVQEGANRLQALHHGLTWADLPVARVVDGRRIITGRYEAGGYRPVLWDLEARAEVGTAFEPVEGDAAIWTQDVSTDASTVAMAAADGRILIYDLGSGRLRQEISGHVGPSGVRFSPDGTTLYSAGIDDGAVRSWDVASGRMTAERSFPEQHANYVAVTADGSRLAVRIDTFGAGGGDSGFDAPPESTVHILDAATLEAAAPIFEAPQTLVTLAWAPDGTTFLAGDAYSGLYQVDGATGELLHTVPLPASAGDLVVTPTGSVLASLNDGGIVAIDPNSGLVFNRLDGHRGAVFSVWYSPEQRRVVSIGNQEVAEWAFGSRPGVTEAGRSDGPLWAAVLDPTHTRFALQPQGTDGRPAPMVVVRPAPPVAVATGSGAAAPEPAAERGATQVALPEGHQLRAWSASGWLTAGEDGIDLIDPGTGAVITAVTTDGPPVAVAMAPGGSAVAYGDDAGAIHVAPVTGGGEPATYHLDEADPDVLSLAWSPDGRALFVGTSFSTSVWRLDLAAGGAGRVVADGSDGAGVLAFDPGGTRLAIGWGGGRIMIVGTDDDSIVADIAIDVSPLELVWSADGSQLAAAGDGGVQLIDVAAASTVGPPVFPAVTTGFPSRGLGFVNEGVLATANFGLPGLRFLAIDPEARIEALCHVVGRNLTSEEWARHLGNRPYRATCSQWPTP